MQAKSDMAANVNVFHVASEMQKTLLNILASIFQSESEPEIDV